MISLRSPIAMGAPNLGEPLSAWIALGTALVFAGIGLQARVR